MKKTFIEPEIKKIELNLKENIAYSGEKYPASGSTYLVFYLNAETEPTCNIIATGLTTDKVTKKDILNGTLEPCFDIGAGVASVHMMMDLS